MGDTLRQQLRHVDLIRAAGWKVRPGFKQRGPVDRMRMEQLAPGVHLFEAPALDFRHLSVSSSTSR
jgi:hypothetical protein